MARREETGQCKRRKRERRMAMERFFPDEELKRASKMGANEDIIHTSKNDDGYDLRTPAEIGKRQPVDENGHA